MQDNLLLVSRKDAKRAKKSRMRVLNINNNIVENIFTAKTEGTRRKAKKIVDEKETMRDWDADLRRKDGLDL